MMAAGLKLPLVPAAFFGMVLGTVGLGGSWRAATKVWGLPAVVGETIILIGALVWLILLLLFAAKWIVAKQDALEEAAHPVLCCFIGLAGVSTMLSAGALLPYAHLLAQAVFIIGAVFTLLFAVWRTGGLWQGGREPASTTAVLYLPTVAGSFVTTIVGSAFGVADWAQFFFGAGLLSWLAIESVLISRLYAVTLPPPLRPTLGIQLAPPAVGAVAYLSVHPGPPDIIAHMLVGYAVLQVLIMLRLLPWLLEGGFSTGFWAFTFGITALSTATIRLIERGDGGTIAVLAPILFVFANVVVGLIAAGTVYQLATGRVPLKWWSPALPQPQQN
jgi:tellurite resistance protein